jgi:ArsR family transcriptional regulator, arsenate/arsenite/antimonite-responsive transcriptional repressor
MNEIEELAEVFRALSAPTRLKLVKLLDENNGALCVNALSDRLGISQSAVSQHLRILRQVGMVKKERRGSCMHYLVDKDCLKKYSSKLRKTLGLIM